MMRNKEYARIWKNEQPDKRLRQQYNNYGVEAVLYVHVFDAKVCHCTSHSKTDLFSQNVANFGDACGSESPEDSMGR